MLIPLTWMCAGEHPDPVELGLIKRQRMTGSAEVWRIQFIMPETSNSARAGTSDQAVEDIRDFEERSIVERANLSAKPLRPIRITQQCIDSAGDISKRSQHHADAVLRDPLRIV